MGREVAALLLASVLLVAGVAKLLDPAGTRRSVSQVGLPLLTGWPLAIGLPLVEATLAVGLVLETTSRAAAAASASLFAAFAAVVGLAAIRGRTAECGCFGQLHSAKVGRGAVTRSSALALFAAGIAATPATSVTWRAVAAAIAAAAVVGQGVLWGVLLRRYGLALTRIEELQSEFISESPHTAESQMPTLRTADGKTFTLGQVANPDGPTLLVLTDERCGACTALYPEIARWQDELASSLTVVVLGQGAPEKLRALAEEHGLTNVLAVDPESFQALAVDGTPAAVFVAPDGTTAPPIRYGALDIEMLVLDAVEASLEVTHPWLISAH